VSLMNSKQADTGSASMSDRARGAAALVIPLSKQAGSTAAQGVQQGVYTVRIWAAPRLEAAADAVTTSVAPRVSTALRTTARQVHPEPAQSDKGGIGWLLSWRGLLAVAAILAAAGGGAAAAMRRRYQSATAAAENDGGELTGTETAEPGMQTDVNGQVPASERSAP
jgi:hypothetical protein